MGFTEFFSSNLTGCVPWFLLLLIVVVLVRGQLFIKMEQSEPPLLQPTIPYIGHAIGFLRHQTKYLAILKYV
jgi:membrane protein DedA with SNARE-associated domain